ncbi:MAG: tryptophan--tRNA ligase, partial [Nitrospinota bacterium]|nr:tryptophan--tRNA ligase [Nitrospinota bacterium]
SFHEAFSGKEENEITAQECQTAKRGCVSCKLALAENVFKRLEPLLEKRAYWSQRPDEVLRILKEGSQKARKQAAATLAEAEEAMHINFSRILPGIR